MNVSPSRLDAVRSGMAGRINGQDASGKWRRECSKLERRLGWASGEIYELWGQVALLRERESVARLPREACEEMAFANCVSMVAKQGAVAD